MAQDKFIIKNGAVIESVLAGETVFDVQKTDKSSILGVNSNGTINLIGNINPSGNFINKLKISNGGISVTGVTTGETIFYDSTGGIVLRGKNTGDQDLSNLSTYTYVDNTFLKLAGGTMTGSLYVNNSTNSTNTTTGAIRTAGGLGVVGNVNVGGTITAPTFIGNASSATKLATVRTIWGQSFDGTGNVDGVFNQSLTNSWLASAKVQIGRINTTAFTDRSVIGTTSGNLHIDPYKGNGLYLNYYQDDGGSSSKSLIIHANGNVLIGTATDSGYKLDVNGTLRATGAVTASRFYAGYDSGAANSMSCSGWFRSNGSSGWLNTTYGGGIYQDDSTYVKVYGNKAFKVTSTASDSINTSGGILASGDINVSGVVGFGTNKCQMSYNSTENSIDFIIN